jgi:acid phosphatase family membrane protein YuiD
MYKYIVNHMKRGAVSNAAFCLLLVLAGTLLCLGAGLLLSALGSLRDMDNQFTTIALPDATAIRRYALTQAESLNVDEYETDYGIIRRDDIWMGQLFEHNIADYMTDRILVNIEQTVYHSGAVDMDPRRYFGAYSPDVVPVYRADSGTSTPGNSGNSAAFVARCVGIEDYYSLTVIRDPDTNAQYYALQANARVFFEIEQIISLHPGIPEPTMISIPFFFRDTDGGYFFAEGGRYFISGQYTPGTGYIRDGSWVEMPAMHSTSLFSFTGPSRQTVVGTLASPDGLVGQTWADVVRWFPNADVTEADFPMEILTWFADEDETQTARRFALGDMTFDEALRSHMGEAVKYAVSVIEKDSNRLNIITTGNLDSLFLFNQHRANIVEGRGFTRKEYENGERVAIIPRRIAEINGLAIGDTLSLTFFEGEYRSISSFITSSTMARITDVRSYRTWLPGGFVSGMREAAEPLDFVVVGLYNAPMPRHENDPHGIPINTLFIPDNAFTGFEEGGQTFTWHDDRAESPMLNVIVVPNGHNEAFRQSINALIPGYGNFFRFYDQGYSVVRPALDNLLRNGWFIFALCLAGWLIAAAVLCLFFVLRRKREAGLLYALGINRRDRFRWVFVQCLVVIVAAQVIAFTLSMVFYEDILDRTVARAFAEAPASASLFTDAFIAEDGVQRDLEVLRSPLAIPLGAVAGFVVLLLAAGGMARGMAKGGSRSLRGVEG